MCAIGVDNGGDNGLPSTHRLVNTKTSTRDMILPIEVTWRLQNIMQAIVIVLSFP